MLLSLARAIGICALLALIGCVDPEPGQVLYVYDDASDTVLVWDHVEALADAAEHGKSLPGPDRRMTAGLLSSFNLAWGGLALDPARQRLYLVAEGGKVVVINNADNRNGALSHRNEIHSFRLDDAGKDRYPSGSRFGQAAMDPQHDVLYVLETAKDGSAARLWHVAKAGSVKDQTVLAAADHTFHVKGDRRGLAVAADPSSGTVYGLFGGGDSIRTGHGEDKTGPRLRQGRTMGHHGTFPSNSHHTVGQNLLVGEKTRLPRVLRHASLAFDGRHHELYVLAKGADAPRLLVFHTGLFTGNLNHEPTRTLDHVPADLRLLAHGGDSEFMAGVAASPAPAKGTRPEPDDPEEETAPPRSQASGLGQGKLYLWKEPSQGKAPLQISSLPGARRIRGLALGGH